jgi:lipoprotein-anchoring transpeptidase ErfK/SrfK
MTIAYELSHRQLSRRHFLMGGASLSALALAGCATTEGPGADIGGSNASSYYMSMYAPDPSEKYPLPPVNVRALNPDILRTEVNYTGSERPGTIVVNTAERRLYLIEEGGKAMRYGVGVGREGFAWSGRGHVGRKAEWPTWTPPTEMLTRDPSSVPYRNGMPGGTNNPLGARAMYIYSPEGRDTLYRIHGTNDPSSIGTAVSSGCIRMIDQDVIDLFGRVPVGTPVHVI